MPSLLQDLKLAFRSLRAAPLTAAAAILVIAIGTGANTAVVAVTYGLLLRPLPYPDVSRLVIVSVAIADGGDFGLQWPEVREWRRRLATVEGLAGYATAELPVRGAGEPRLVRTALVTDGFFSVLGAPPARGQVGAVAEPGGGVVLSERFARFSPGESVKVGDRVRTVAAVMAPPFAFPSDETLVWVAAEPRPDLRGAEAPAYRLVARLRPGVSLDQFREDAGRVMREVRGAHTTSAPKIVPVEEALTGGLRPVLGAAVAAAQLVLIVTCGNVAMLLLGRALAKRRDAAVRLALGAGRWQLARLPLAESLLLAAAGSLLGAGLAYAGVRVFARLAAGAVPRAHAIEMDLPVLAVSAALAVVITLLCGAAPALQVAGRDFLAAFRGGGGDRLSAGGRGILAGLVVGQVAVATVLLTGAALLVRTVSELMAEDAGFEPERALVVKLPLGAGTQDRAAFVQNVLERVRTLPGVQVAGMGTSLPPKGLPFQIFVSAPALGESSRMSVVSATPGFLDALGVRPASGRLFTQQDQRPGEPVLILSESAARFASAVAGARDGMAGRELPFPLPPVATFDGRPRVAGVVPDVKYAGLDVPADAALYLPLDTARVSTLYLAVRTAGEPAVLESVAPAVRRILREADPALPVGEIRSLEDEMASSILDRRLRAVPAAGFAAVALAVALTGVFALLSRSVAERRRELAVRIALGASQGGILGLVLRRAAALTGAGLIFGLAGSLAVARGLDSLLYGVGSRDPLTLGAVALTVAVAGLLAAWIPARRAARVEPLELLRTE